MGTAKSRPKGGSRGKNRGVYGQTGPSNGNVSVRGLDYEDLELLLLRRALQRNPEIFVLNNLMMCVQFFGNYQEEIQHIKETLVSSREERLNKHLPPQKHVLLPDVLQEQVARNVGFTSTRQTVRPTIEPLHPVRIYIVHNNIDVTQPNYPTHYSKINNCTRYNMLIRPTDHEGCVQLQLAEETTVPTSVSKEEEIDLSSIAEDDDEIFSDGDSIYGPRANSNLMLPRRPRESNMRSGLYDHARSMPNLHDEDVIYESQEDIGRYRSAHSVKHESDYEHASSAEEQRYRSRAWSRGELSMNADTRRHQRHAQRGRSQKLGNHSRASSTSSGYRSGNYGMDSDSSCNTVQNQCSTCLHSGSRKDESMYASKHMTDQEADYFIATGELPPRCFKKVTYTPEGKVYDPREERRLVPSKQRRIKQVLKRHNYNVSYTSSTEFMRHFTNLFVYQMAEQLGFDKDAVEDVKQGGCVLYCDKVMISKSLRYSRVEQYEILPAVWLEWPACAQEWLDRPRSTWPHYDDVEKIKDFGCYVVPEGFAPKMGSNLIEDLEWQLTFPAAERYLETCMTQAQVQIYLIALMLHKTFMRPVIDTVLGLTTSHIRNKLFWMIEENDRPSKWPENRMGECLLTLLNSLYHSISQHEPTLPDYFVRDRNLFQRVPSEHLLHTQKQLKRIIENPVMYVFHAMENIQHSEKFFPRLDYERLLRILTVDVLALLNPAIVKTIPRSMQSSSKENLWDEKYDKSEFWDTVKVRTQKKVYASRPVTNKTLINPRKATDSVIEISIRCAELEAPRLYALLDFFVRHFINIAECCHQYRAIDQKRVYLDQADRLSILLSEHPIHKDDGKAYRDKIKVLRKKNVSQRLQDDPPQTPRRNLETPVFVARLKERFIQESLYPKSANRETKEESPDTDTDRDSGSRKVVKAIVHGVRFEEAEDRETKKTDSKRNAEDRGPKKTGVRWHTEERRPKRADVIENNEEPKISKQGDESRRKSTETKGESEHVISLAETHNDSFLTETTYI